MKIAHEVHEISADSTAFSPHTKSNHIYAETNVKAILSTTPSN